MTMRIFLPALLLALPLAACNGHDRDPAVAAAPGHSIGRVAQAAADQARATRATRDFTLSARGQPRAQITPQGQLRIDGHDVVMTAAQRTQLLAYRRQLEAIAVAGLEIGASGADLGAQAAVEALKGVLSGTADSGTARIGARADQLRAQADALCARLPALLSTQQALAASLPAFAPYASLDASTLDDCGQ